MNTLKMFWTMDFRGVGGHLCAFEGRIVQLTAAIYFMNNYRHGFIAIKDAHHRT